ncbi:hypothetical protein LPJ64_006085 [Coemansia asiatica]|uniref:26S proteasome non-ATPase regulatory subunit 5 n=1 Tax=Coemansia asiatica TaxID=1052880 RepID=A0A9W8CGC7_9FUNG|nr:hypothetical protein LPJ64_006085 [Coemansia asiatica]
MQHETDYVKTIKQICELLRSDPTPEVINGLRESFEDLSKQLRAGPFLEVFETTLGNIPFAALFSLLAAPDNKLIVIVAEVTGQLLKPVTWSMVHQTFEDYIVQGLDHPHPVVKCLVLDQFLKCEQSSDPFSPQYGPHLWKCLSGKNDSDSTKTAKKALVHLFEIGMGIDYLLTSESIAVVRKLLAGSESQRFRIYDVMAAAIKKSDSAFEFFRQEGILDTFLSEAASGDILVSVNFYETVPKFCSSAVPFEYLVSTGVFSKALQCLIDAEKDKGVTSSLMQVAVLKLFSRMVDVEGADAKTFLEKHAFVNELTNILESSESSSELRSTAISCLGTIGNSPRALEYLTEEKKALAAFAEIYKSSLSHMRVECLQAIACIFGHSQTPSKEMSQACYELYMQLDNGGLLVSLTKEIMKGFEESCVAGFAVIQKMALHVWGIREISNHQNIVNFLLMRDASRGKNVQQWQFAVIQEIVRSPSAKDAFDADTFARLSKYEKEGPYFVNSVPQVALRLD